MKKDFSFYEFAGIIVPGATLLLGLSTIFQPVREFLASDKFNLGELGLFVIASYVIGHLLQGVGNWLEAAVWAFRGMPSTWIRREHPPFLSDAQVAILQTALPVLLGHPLEKFRAMDLRTCAGIRGQLYARLQEAGKVERIDTFNGNYGMFRGIASALLVVLAACIWKFGLRTPQTAILTISFGLALLRMHRFGVHYGAELYRQALNLWTSQNPKPGPLQ